MITYSTNNSTNCIIVKFGDRIVGFITQVPGGFRYTPKGKPVGDRWSGDVLPSVTAVKATL